MMQDIRSWFIDTSFDFKSILFVYDAWLYCEFMTLGWYIYQSGYIKSKAFFTFPFSLSDILLVNTTSA